MTKTDNSCPLSILITLQYYLPHRTGYSLYVQRMADALVSQGHQVTVLTARHSKKLPRRETINGVKLVRLWSPIRVSRGMVMPAYPWAMWRLLCQHNVVWVQLPMLETSLTSLLTRMTGRGLIATVHGDLVLPKGRFNHFIERFVYKHYAFMAKRAHKIIGYSRDYADHSYYLNPFRDKVSTIYPPIQVPEPEPVRVAELRAKWQHKDGPVVGYAGRFVQEKRPSLLIRSLAVINDHYPDARIVFAGEYDIQYENTWQVEQPLVQKFKEQLVFLGLLDDPQMMANFYAACDVLVLPSDTECFALVQVEAMLCGTPVVMTDTPGGRVPVIKTGMGRIVPRGDWQAIGQAVIDIVQNPEQYQIPKDKVEAMFNFTETVRRYQNHLHEAARGSRHWKYQNGND